LNHAPTLDFPPATSLSRSKEWRVVGVTGEQLQQWCALFGHPLLLVGAGRLLAFHEPREQKGRVVACFMWDGHAYLYRDGRALKSYRSENIQEDDAPLTEQRRVLEQESRGQLELWSDQKLYPCAPQPGLFYVADLAWERKRLLASGRNAKVSLRDHATYSQLTYHCVKALDGCTGSCHIREDPPYASAMVQWLERLPLQNLQYRGERLPALALGVFLALLKAKRRTPSAEEQTTLLKEHDGRCALCGGVFDGDLEWDHVVPLRQLSKASAQRFQPVCASCHEEKTALEGRQDRTLRSCFSAHAWKFFVQSPKLPPLVFVQHQASCDGSGSAENEPLFELDVRRCRRNALAHSARFSVLMTASSPRKLGRCATSAL
jgi:hypothetical protein